MQYTTLGRTGLKVSVAGLGGGGGSRLGLAQGKTADEAADLVRLALDLGVNLIDTAESYKTEDVIGAAIKGRPRDSIVLSTKHMLSPHGDEKTLYPAAKVIEGLNQSLRKLGTDYVDIFHLHALTIPRYEHAISQVLPALMREREKGKFRFLGITEAPTVEHRHDALVRALDDDLCDVAMVSFQILHQNARELVFPKTLERQAGTLLMFVVRNIFADIDHLRTVFARLAAEGRIPAELARKANPLDTLVHSGGAADNIEAAYRFARHEPGADVIMFGTGSAAHLRRNIASITAPALPERDRVFIRETFGHLVGVGLDIPKRTSPAA